MILGITMGLLASASWATANVFVQRSGRLVGPFRALLWAQVVGILALAPFALALDRRAGGVIDGSHLSLPTILTWGAIAAVSAVLAYSCLFYSSAHGRLSVVVPIMSSWSVVSAAISLGLLGEKLRRAHWIGAGLVVTGVMVVSRFSQPAKDPAGDPVKVATKVATELPTTSPQADDARASAKRRERGALWGAVGTALGFGVLIPAIHRLTPVTGNLGVIPVVFLLDLLLGVPLALAAGIGLRPPPRAALGAVAAAGLFETVGFVWIGIGVSHAPIAVVSPLAGLSSAFTVLFAWLVLRERPPALVLVGAGIACAGVVVLAL
jgi:drug/metabolite transporter (DMT)-like permease